MCTYAGNLFVQEGPIDMRFKRGGGGGGGGKTHQGKLRPP